MIKNILIVEDDVVFCKLLTRFLTKNSYTTKDAQSAKQAFELLKEQTFDLAILDYRLPDDNGLSILESIKEGDKVSKVILITRYGDQEVANKAIDLGADAYVSKPINPDELLNVIQNL
ncbi:response regulator [Litoribacter ruber]|uniref:Response regulator n=2 Tax=Litoribacter ruber TaxID=702568 RepID=A0AAP2G1M3_9BACT|nr:response regulator [Litoribacter alkaliphilus]MBT0811955.1 response regulator [Litoribacter ruber]